MTTAITNTINKDAMTYEQIERFISDNILASAARARGEIDVIEQITLTVNTLLRGMSNAAALRVYGVATGATAMAWAANNGSNAHIEKITTLDVVVDVLVPLLRDRGYLPTVGIA
jgi:hypothetical protein